MVKKFLNGKIHNNIIKYNPQKSYLQEEIGKYKNVVGNLMKTFRK